ncbi:hypothetical protein [Desulfovibrio sp. DV]|uniref:hypothetical protein n=1 Tax=Desulfovibrio sp. DV TaxID=1844708 RepID=UPI00111507C5|nr:hypothetical protein [Desulfovibrio sp. DV]
MKYLVALAIILFANIEFGYAWPSVPSAQGLDNPPAMHCEQANCRSCWEGQRQNAEAFRRSCENFRLQCEGFKGAVETGRVRFESERRNSMITSEKYQEEFGHYVDLIMTYQQILENYYRGIQIYKELGAAYQQGVKVCQY